MPSPAVNTRIDLVGVIVAVTDDEPRILVVNHGKAPGLPSGPFLPDQHKGLQDGLRSMVKGTTGLELFYIEQLYSFGNRFRDHDEIDGGPRVVSIAYIALTHETPVSGTNAEWRDCYDFLPWEDWRKGPPPLIADGIEPALEAWIQKTKKSLVQRERRDRVRTSFGNPNSAEMDAVVALERYELLYEAQLIEEARRDAVALGQSSPDEAIDDSGSVMISDHRRILATALSRLRGKLAYRPVVFELLPGEFTLLQLQVVAEALSGAPLHKQNFRRLVINADLVEPVGRASTGGPGRPAELFRFRREVLGEKLAVGLSRPVMRRDRG